MNDHCADNCPVIPRVVALEEANRQHSDTHREIFRRLGAVETAAAVQDSKLDAIIQKIDGVAEKVDGLEAKPARRWDSLVDKLLFAAAGAVIAWISAGMPGMG